MEGNEITAAGTVRTITIPAVAKVIDTNGRTVLPGIMDMHVDLMILGHGDCDHWNRTYLPKFRDVISDPNLTTRYRPKRQAPVVQGELSEGLPGLARDFRLSSLIVVYESNLTYHGVERHRTSIFVNPGLK